MKEKISLIVVIIILALIPIGIKYYDSNIKHIEIKRDADENEPQDEDYSSGMRIILIGGSNKKENENTNSMGYIVLTANGRLIIVDGGIEADSDDIFKYISKYGNGKVDYWFLTHAHVDHVGAFIKLIDTENIEVSNVCYNLNTAEWYEVNDSRGKDVAISLLNHLSNPKIKNRISCEKGQIINIDNVICEVIRVSNPEITNSDNGNEASMTFKITAKDVDKSILFLGDSFNEASKELIQSKDKLKSYAVQVAHHGQNGVTKEVYDAIDPTICFYNAPEWIWNNDSGEGYNSGKLKTIEVRGWLDSMAEKSFVAYEGDQEVWLNKDGYKEIKE